jgi:hypothetical protein
MSTEIHFLLPGIHKTVEIYSGEFVIASRIHIERGKEAVEPK